MQRMKKEFTPCMLVHPWQPILFAEHQGCVHVSGALPSSMLVTSMFRFFWQHSLQATSLHTGTGLALWFHNRSEQDMQRQRNIVFCV
jgi:hypothetical protein